MVRRSLLKTPGVAGLSCCLLAFLLPFLFSAPAMAAEGPWISGRVMDGPSPVEGAWVELTPLVGRWQLGDLLFQGKTRPEPMARTATRPDGSFRLRAPDVGMWRLTVGGDGLVPAQVSLVPLYRDVELPDADLGPDHGLTVRVTDPVGRPLAAAAVLAYSSSQARLGRTGLPSPAWQRATELAFTDEDGRVRLRGRRGETVRLQVAEPDHPSATAEVRLPVPGGLEVQLERGRRVTLRAVRGVGASETPIPDALAWAGEVPFPIGWTGIEGLTSVVLPRRGSVALLALDGSGGRAAYELSTSSKVESVRLPFREPEAHAGRVLRRGSQEPVAGALVWSWYRPDDFVRSDAEGRFHLGAVDSGGYLSAVRAGYLPTGLRLEDRGGVGSNGGDGSGSTVLQLQAVGSLAGLVVDARGEAVAGLGLRPERPSMSWSADSAWPFRSGPDGSFHLPDLPAETEVLVGLGGADEEGRRWATVVREIEPLSPGEDRTGVVLRAEPGLTAFGLVVDEVDVAVAGALVRLANAYPSRRELHLPALPPREAHTGEDGFWEMTALRGGVFDLEVWAQGFAPTVVPGVEVGSEAEGLGTAGLETVDLGTVVLTPGSELTGSVLDIDRRPVAGAEVWAREAGRSDLYGRSRTVTDDDGRFVLRDLRGGARVAVLADHPEFLAAQVEPVAVPAHDEYGEGLTIVMERGTSILGRVTDESGRPVARAGVAIFAQGGGGSARAGQSTAATDAQGDFALHHVPAGPATLQVNHREFPSHSEPVQLLPAHLGPTRVDVVLRGADGSLRGLVRDERGEPVAAALVLLPGDGILRSASAHTDAEGAFQMNNVDPGRREVVVHHAAFASFRTETEVTTGSWLDVELRRGVSVSGRVVGGDGLPVAGAGIDTTPTGEAGRATREGAVSAADGSFTVERLVAGRYLLSARAAGYYAPQEPEPVELEGDVEGVVIELRRGVTLEGRVEGVPFDDLPGVAIEARRLTSDLPTYPLPARAELDYEGSFRLEGLSPGVWRVSAEVHPEGGRRAVDVEIGEGRAPDPIVLEMGNGYRVRGAVLFRGAVQPGGSGGSGGSGSWSSRSRLVLTPMDDHGRAEPGHRMSRLGREGRFEFRDVEPGSYELSVAGIAGRLWSQDLEVRDDVDVTMEVRIASLAGTVRDRTGRPLGDVHVGLTGLTAGGGEDLERRLAASTGDDGRFFIETLPPGAYTLQVHRQGYGLVEQGLVVSEGPTNELDVVLDPLPE